MSFGKFCELCELCENGDFKCGSDSGEDTTDMKVSYEGKKYAVSVCSVCEDDATPKTIREKIAEKLEKYQALVDQAKELDIELDIDALIAKKGELIIAGPETPTAPVPVQQPQVIVETQPQRPEERLATEDGRSRANEHKIHSRSLQSIEPSGAMGGRIINVPKHEIGNAGTTHFTVNMMSSKQFDERFKRQCAKSRVDPSMGGNQGHVDYANMSCPNCRGTGFLQNTVNGTKKPKICQQCDGLGQIDEVQDMGKGGPLGPRRL
jgi:hypothetical protein